jgi:hypothetical protein
MTILYALAVVGALVIIVLAWVGLRKVLDDLRERSASFVPDLWPMYDTGLFPSRNRTYPRLVVDNTQRAPQPAFKALPAPAPLKPSAKPFLALPAPAKPKPARRLPSYISVAADNGAVPAYRSQANFAAKGKLRSVPRSIAGYVGW